MKSYDTCFDYLRKHRVALRLSDDDRLSLGLPQQKTMRLEIHEYDSKGVRRLLDPNLKPKILSLVRHASTRRRIEAF